jgi:hypothetical protein
MPSNVDWEAVGQQALKILEEEFGPVLEEATSAEAKTRLALVSREIATYWALAQAGDPKAQENLKWLKAEMKLILARYAIKTAVATQRAWLKAFDLICTIGARLVMALVVAA